MNSLVFFVSDIHYTGKCPESEGVVLRNFLEDMKKQLLDIPHKDAYVLIGGDLVQAADNKEMYEGFWNDFILPMITLGIKKEHILCVPGNHDIERKWICENKPIYAPLINKQYTENKFNDLVENPSQSKFLIDKFNNYSDFATEKLEISNYDPIGFHFELNDEWSVYCLNSSLTSFGGIIDQEYPDLKDDVKKLNVDTRKINSWIATNLKKKILLLHHPMDFLTEWSSCELKKLIKLNFDIVLTGHTHEQEILCNENERDSYIWCKAPQLYSDKTDKLGYCIIDIEEQFMGAMINFEGDVSGVVALCFSKMIVKEASMMLLGEESQSDEELLDVISEFTNIIAGRAKAVLSEHNLSIGISLPKACRSEDEIVAMLVGKQGVQVNLLLNNKPLILFLAH